MSKDCGGINCVCPEKPKQKELTLNDVINYYYSFLHKSIWPIFNIDPPHANASYNIEHVLKSIVFYGPDYPFQRTDEQKKIAEAVNIGFLSILTLYNTSTSPDYIFGYIKDLTIPNVERLLKPDNSAQIAELTAIRQNLINKRNEIKSKELAELRELESRKAPLQTELNRLTEKMKIVEKESYQKRVKLNENINNIQDKINKLK